MRSVATARAATHRGLLASQLAVLGDAQHIATEAGYWLAAGHRLIDAVVAVEHSRAVLLATDCGRRTGHPRGAAGRRGDGTAECLPRRVARGVPMPTGASTRVPLIAGAARRRPGTGPYQAGSGIGAGGWRRRGLARADPADRGGHRTTWIRWACRATRRSGRLPAKRRSSTSVRRKRAGYALIVRYRRPTGAGLAVRAAAPAGLEAAAEDLQGAAAHSGGQVRSCVDWLSAVLQGPARPPAWPGTRRLPSSRSGSLNLVPVNAALIEATLYRSGGPVERCAFCRAPGS